MPSKLLDAAGGIAGIQLYTERLVVRRLMVNSQQSSHVLAFLEVP